MSARAATSVRTRRFHTSIVGVVSAVCLATAVGLLAAAAQEPLRPAVIYVINFLIMKGRFNALNISDIGPMWTSAIQSLGAGAVALGLGLTLAYWNSRKAGTA